MLNKRENIILTVFEIILLTVLLIVTFLVLYNNGGNEDYLSTDNDIPNIIPPVSEYSFSGDMNSRYVIDNLS